MQNRVFFAQAALDAWLADGQVELSGIELTVVEAARRYRLAEAAHVVREVTGAADAHELVGRVKSTQYLQELGAELLEGSMILGDNAYDVVPGFMAAPVGAFEEFVKSPECLQARKGRTGPEPRTEEAILGRLTAAR